MPAQCKWGWFKDGPIDICKNAIVSDACHRGAPVKVLANGGEHALIEYKGETDFVPSSGLFDRPAPEFEWEDKVIITANGNTACVLDVCWHFNAERYYYYLKDDQGKKLKKRYLGTELVKA